MFWLFPTLSTDLSQAASISIMATYLTNTHTKPSLQTHIYSPSHLQTFFSPF